MITVIKDKPLIYDVNNYDVILIGTSINNALGNGFQYQIKKAFPEVNEANKNTPYGDMRKLGDVHVVNLKPVFCLCYLNKGRYRPDISPDYLNYEALESCMKLINENFKGKKIAGTILGHSIYEGDGDKERILNIIKANSNDINLTLYDFEQENYNTVRTQKWLKVIDAAEKGDKDLYRKIKMKYHWEETFGLLKPIPEDKTEKEIKEIIKTYKKKE